MRQVRKVSFAVFALAGSFAVSALSAPQDFRSRRAVEASARYKLAIEKARKRYLAELRGALPAATRSGDLAEANRIKAEIEKTRIKLRKIHGREREISVTVQATQNGDRACRTKLVLRKGETFTIIPDPSDRWYGGGGSKKGVRCNYMGYTDRGTWMRMYYQIGKGVPVPVVSGKAQRAGEDGELKLFASDDKAEGNTGEIRVKIVMGDD